VEREAQQAIGCMSITWGRLMALLFPGGEAKDFPVVLGEGRTLKEFEGSLTGMKTGESKSFDVTFPDDYFAKELAGKTANFNVTVKSVHEAKMPEVDAALPRAWASPTAMWRVCVMKFGPIWRVKPNVACRPR
jgi:FKBP-type peptidyl-prolyl cis-trans isomerase 2